MLDTHFGVSRYTRNTVFLCQFWKHTETHPGYTPAATWTKRPLLPGRFGNLTHGTADKLVFCHEAMHIQLRMQNAGWSADVERWESDEDSDASDEGDADVQLSDAAVLHLMA